MHGSSWMPSENSLTPCLVLARQEAGALSVGGVSVQRRLSFLDYMAGGCEIQCMIAIDFSGSNAPTTDPASCHYAGTPTPNFDV